MIYTVTFNPALDYIVRVDDLTLGAVNRTTYEEILYGGKGINVSVVLNNLGFQSQALGFIAGFTGIAMENGLHSLGINTNLITVDEGMTRINIKIKSDQESEINGQGPKIQEQHINSLLKQLDQLQAGDVLVLAGSIPNTLPQDIYGKIMEELSGRQIKFIVDATNDLLVNVLKYHPFLIKPNIHELEEIFSVSIKTDEDIILYGKKLQEQGALNVLISMAGAGSLLITETGDIHRMGAAKGTVVNSVGAGDSMVAGFLAGYLGTDDYEYALKMGTAAGGASAFSEHLATKDDIMALIKTL